MVGYWERRREQEKKEIKVEENCKFLASYYNQNKHKYCTHKDNTDFRSKGRFRKKRLISKRCLPEFCPLK